MAVDGLLGAERALADGALEREPPRLFSGGSSRPLAARGDGGDDGVQLMQGLHATGIPARIVASAGASSDEEVLDVVAGAGHGERVRRQHLFVAACFCLRVHDTLCSVTHHSADRTLYIVAW